MIHMFWKTLSSYPSGVQLVWKPVAERFASYPVTHSSVSLFPQPLQTPGPNPRFVIKEDLLKQSGSVGLIAVSVCIVEERGISKHYAPYVQHVPRWVPLMLCKNTCYLSPLLWRLLQPNISLLVVALLVSGSAGNLISGALCRQLCCKTRSFKKSYNVRTVHHQKALKPSSHQQSSRFRSSTSGTFPWRGDWLIGPGGVHHGHHLRAPMAVKTQSCALLGNKRNSKMGKRLPVYSRMSCQESY